MKTDEAQWKERVKKLFKEVGEELYYHMPVMNGMGAPTLDFICCWQGRYFAVETKDKSKDLTLRQCITRDNMIKAGGVVFRVRNAEELELLRAWLGVVNPAPALGGYISDGEE